MIDKDLIIDYYSVTNKNVVNQIIYLIDSKRVIVPSFNFN